MTQPDAPQNAADDAPARIAAGYETSGPALTLGSVVHDGRPHPERLVRLPLAIVDRYGLVAGATVTGKTKTLQLMAEQLSAAGVPVVVADMKGDLSGLAQAGESSDRVVQRVAATGDAWTPTGSSPRSSAPRPSGPSRVRRRHPWVGRSPAACSVPVGAAGDRRQVRTTRRCVARVIAT